MYLLNKLTFGVAGVAFLSVLSGVALAQGQQGQITRPLKDGVVYWNAGGGGTSGIIIGNAGVVIIDAKTTPDAGHQLVEEVAKLTSKPITHIILTHSDCDHVNGLPGFPPGIAIIAHENNKKESEDALKAGGRGMPPADRMPTQLVTKDREAITIDGINLVLLHYGPAHTNGDLAVFLPDYKIVFAGDILTTTVLIHPDKDGTLDGWFKFARGFLALDADTFVPGHPTMNMMETKAGIQKRIDENQAKRDKIDAMMKEGKPVAEIKAAMGDPANPTGGCRGIPFPTFTDVEVQYQTKK